MSGMSHAQHHVGLGSPFVRFIRCFWSDGNMLRLSLYVETGASNGEYDCKPAWSRWPVLAQYQWMAQGIIIHGLSMDVQASIWAFLTGKTMIPEQIASWCFSRDSDLFGHPSALGLSWMTGKWSEMWHHWSGRQRTAANGIYNIQISIPGIPKICLHLRKHGKPQTRIGYNWILKIVDSVHLRTSYNFKAYMTRLQFMWLTAGHGRWFGSRQASGAPSGA